MGVPTGRSGGAVLVLFALVALLAPVLTPYDPGYFPEDTPAHRFRSPLDTVTIFGHTTRGEIACVDWEVDGEDLVLHRGRDYSPSRARIADLGEPARGWTRAGDTVRRTDVGGREVPVRHEFHLLGTDRSGRDLLTRMLHGTQISLLVGIFSMLVAVTIGTLLGALAGYFGGVIDVVIMRLVDVLIAFPRLVLLLVLVMAYDEIGLLTIVLVLGLSGWMSVARLVRAEFLRLRELEFAVAARAVGAGHLRRIVRHLLPNALSPVLVAATLRVGDAILLEASLSFLGFGAGDATASWGKIIASGRSELLTGVWWVSTLPGLMIVAVVAAVHLVGAALRTEVPESSRRLSRTVTALDAGRTA